MIGYSTAPPIISQSKANEASLVCDAPAQGLGQISGSSRRNNRRVRPKFGHV